MSNKSVSVYAKALQRQHEAQLPHTAADGVSLLHANEGPQPPENSEPITIAEEKPISQAPVLANPTKKHNRVDGSYHDSKQASLLSRYHDSRIALLRSIVRFSGKEAFFGRFTPEEKHSLKEVAYTYQQNGIKTTENEIARIAVNLLLDDYHQNGETSVLDRVLKALHE